MPGELWPNAARGLGATREVDRGTKKEKAHLRQEMGKGGGKQKKKITLCH